MRHKAMVAIGGLAYSLLQTVGPAKANILEKLFLPAQHAVIPFDAGRKGAVALTDYHASRDASFYFYLNLKIPENQPAFGQQVQSIAGSGATFHGVPVNNGVPIPLRISIARIDRLGTTMVFDRTFQEEQLESHGQGYFSKIITAVALTRGDYKVRVEALEDIAALDGIPVDFDIHIPGNLK